MGCTGKYENPFCNLSLKHHFFYLCYVARSAFFNGKVWFYGNGDFDAASVGHWAAQVGREQLLCWIYRSSGNKSCFLLLYQGQNCCKALHSLPGCCVNQ